MRKAVHVTKVAKERLDAAKAKKAKVMEQIEALKAQIPDLDGKIGTAEGEHAAAVAAQTKVAQVLDESSEAHSGQRPVPQVLSTEQITELGLGEAQATKLQAMLASPLTLPTNPGAAGVSPGVQTAPAVQTAPPQAPEDNNAYDRAAAEGSTDFDEFMGDLEKEASHTAQELREHFGKWVEKNRPRRASPIAPA